MSATGLEVFDKTVQTTNIWLDEIMDEIGPDRHVAWHVLGGVLRVLRDRVPPELAAHLGAQLPILIRGLYYDQWRPSEIDRARSRKEFLQQIAEELSDTRPVDAAGAATTVFRVLSRHVSRGQAENVRNALPTDIRRLWPADFLDLSPDRAQITPSGTGVQA